MAVHDHTMTYGHMHQRLVAAFTAHVIMAVQPPHPHLLVTTNTTVNQEIQIPVPLLVFCIQGVPYSFFRVTQFL